MVEVLNSDEEPPNISCAVSSCPTVELVQTTNIDAELDFLSGKFDLSAEELIAIRRVNAFYPMKISAYYLRLIHAKDDAIWRMCVPDMAELEDTEGEEDPLCEERDSPTPLITHRYPDRCLMLISDTCAMYCRFCTRKRKVGTDRLTITYAKIDKAISYIRQHTEIRDVILSGGDAFCAPIERLEYTIGQLCHIDHVEIVRLGTRVPAVNPVQVTDAFVAHLKPFLEFKPIFINVHFEHPAELTQEAKVACLRLANAGFPLNNQNVLLDGVNADAKTMGDLWKGLLQFRVRPYYLFQADYVKGTNHFRTPVETGITVMKGCRGWISGMAIPHYVIDSPDGKGKIPVDLGYVTSLTQKTVKMHNYLGLTAEYPQRRP